MPKGIGRLISFGVAKESSRGTAPGAATYYIPFQDLSFDEKQAQAEDTQAYGVIEDSTGMSKVKEWAEGMIKAIIGDKHFPLILYSLFGSLSTSDDADSDASIKDHAITVAQSAQHQSLAFYLDDPIGGQDYTHALGVVDSLAINYERGKFVDYEAKLKSKKGVTATLTPSITTENKFLPQHVTFKLASTQSGLDVASALSIKSLKLNINQNIEDDDVLGSIAPADFLTKNFVIEGELEAIFQNESDFKTQFLANTGKAMRIDLKNTDVTIGSAANPEIKIDLYKVIFKALNKPVKIGDIMMQSLSFKAHYSISDSKMVQVTCVNAVASY
jgi:hypothetical protein